MAVRFAKLAANLHRHPKIRRAGRAAREVFVWAVCCNADEYGEGRVSEDYFDPDHLAEVLMMDASEAAAGLARCIETGLLARDGDEIVLVGWNAEEWGNPKSGADRTRKWRESKRVTCHEGAASPVTSGDEVTSRDVTRDASDVEEKRVEEKRREETRTEGGAGGSSLAAGPAASQPIGRTRSKPKPSDPTADERIVIERVLGKLSTNSGRSYAAVHSSGKLTGNGRMVLSLLRAGHTEDDLRLVVWECSVRWAKDEQWNRYLQPSTLFGPVKFDERLALAKGEWAKRQHSLHQRDRPRPGAILDALAHAQDAGGEG